MTLFGGNFAFEAAATREVNLGVDKGAVGTDSTGGPHDARAEFVLNYNSGTNGFMETGISPGTGGPVVSWTDKGDIVTAIPYTNSDYEYKWELVLDEGGMTLTPPVAASTWEDFGASKTWEAIRASTGAKSWEFNVTVRHKVQTTDTDTVKITLTVEGL